MKKNDVLTAIPLLFIPLFLYLVLTARQEMKYHSCHMPMVAQGDELLLSACQDILRVSTEGAILAKGGFDQLGLSPQVYALDIGEEGTVLLSDMKKRAVKQCEGDLSECRDRIHARRGGDLRRPFAARRLGERLYIADPNNNRIGIYDLANKLERYVDDGFDYPNDISIHGQELIVADTRNYRLVIYEHYENGQFGPATTLDLKTLRPAEQPTRPLTAVKDGVGDFWIIMADHLIVGQDVVVIGPEGEVIKTIGLPAGAEPFGLTVLGEKVLISDPANEALYMVDAQGQAQPFAPGSELAVYLAQSAEAGARVRQKFMLGFVGAIACLFLWLLLRIKFASVTDEPQSSLRRDIDVHNPDIVWIAASGQQSRIMLVLMLPLIMLMVMGSILYPLLNDETAVVGGLTGEPLTYILLLSLLLAPVGLIVYAQRLKNQRLGVLGSTLIFQAPDKKIVAAEAKDIAYSHNLIFIGDKTLNLGAGGNIQIFPGDKLVEYVYPLLKQARYIEPSEAQRRMLTLKGGQKQFALAAVVIIAFLFMYILYRYFL